MNDQQRITCLSTNDDNSFLVGGSLQTIWLWRLKPKYEQIKFDGHEGWVTSVSLSKITVSFSWSFSNSELFNFYNVLI